MNSDQTPTQNTPIIVPNHPEDSPRPADQIDPKSKDTRSAAPGEGSGITGQPAKRTPSDPQKPQP